MKKFEIPEISCVELSKTEAIMVSTNAGTSYENYVDVDSELKGSYKIWKGFKN